MAELMKVNQKSEEKMPLREQVCSPEHDCQVRIHTRCQSDGIVVNDVA
jgi:hypothetical protein